MITKFFSAFAAILLLTTVFSSSNIVHAGDTILREACVPELLTPGNRTTANKETLFTWKSCPVVNDSYEFWVYYWETQHWGMHRVQGESEKLIYQSLTPGKPHKWKLVACYNLACTVKSKFSETRTFIWTEPLIGTD